MKQLSIFILALLSCFVSVGQIDKKQIEIDKGNRYTKKPTVPLNLYYAKAVKMRLSNNNNLTYVNWVEYDDYIASWELSENDGKKTVYVQYKLGTGEETEVFSDEILLDTEAPSNITIEFDIDGEYFTDPSMKVPLYIQAKGAKYMKLSNSSSFYANRWMIFKEEIDEWKLAEGEDGPRFIYAKFKDVAQNETEVIKVSITVDRQAPFLCAVAINNGDKFSINQDRNVSLDLTARGADFMMIGTDENLSNGKWEAYSPDATFQLDEEDGLKTIYVKYKDVAGNESKVVSSKIYQDLTAPKECQAVMDGGAESTSEPNKYVSLALTAPKDVQFVMISNTESFYGAKWRLYTPNVKWKLAGENDGERTVYVKFKDRAGNISGIFSDSIMLQRSF